VTERPKVVQDREKGPHAKASATEGKLLYTMEQWRAFRRKKEEESGPSGSSKNITAVHVAARRRRRRGPGVTQALMVAPPASTR
jgi:hypothetical protein